jgi:putative sigma-54 modulation protein
MSVEKHRQISEINLHANGVRIHAKESTADMYASVDACLAKLDRQIRKFKDRINRHQPRTARELRNYHLGVIERVESEAPEDGRVPVMTAAHRLVKREKLEMKPMDVEEAVMQLDLLDDTFLVFANAVTQQVNVIYARDDGTYGLIEPQS